jgi:hypothetical protein
VNDRVHARIPRRSHGRGGVSEYGAAHVNGYVTGDGTGAQLASEVESYLGSKRGHTIGGS